LVVSSAGRSCRAVSDGSQTVDGLLSRIASPRPEGGGGAAAALTAATAAALVAMVGGVAARHAPADAGLGEIVAEAQTLRRRLTALIERDVDAFRRVLEAARRKDDTRAMALRDALVGATEVPLELAAASARVLERCVALAPAARPSTLADLGVAGALAAAALEGAALTARVNLEGLDAPAFVADTRRRLDQLLGEGTALRGRLAGAVADRMSRSTS
jgi:formiminotetrahydrofolate cyclodeaminase